MRLLRLIPLVTLVFTALNVVPSSAQTSNPQETYKDLFITSLRERGYGEGEFKIEQTLQVTNAFTRSLVSFDSDGLKQYGFMNTPKGAGPFPAMLVLHGYVNPKTYRTPYTYTQRYADLLARQGFLVIHPDYRGHGRSEGEAEGNTNLFRVGYAIDVLNLIAHVKKLPNVRPDAIGLFGHSMGGGIAQRVLTVSRDVKAAVLYGAMNADERLNEQQITTVFRPGQRVAEQEVPLQVWDEISPVNYLGDITAAIEIHHGGRDSQVPLAWSKELNARLTKLGKSVALFEYPGADHSLQGRDYTAMMTRVVEFFRRNL